MTAFSKRPTRIITGSADLERDTLAIPAVCGSKTIVVTLFNDCVSLRPRRHQKTESLGAPLGHNFASLLVNLEVEGKWLFLNEEIIIKIIITSRLVGFSGKSFDRFDIVAES